MAVRNGGGHGAARCILDLHLFARDEPLRICRIVRPSDASLQRSLPNARTSRRVALLGLRKESGMEVARWREKASRTGKWNGTGSGHSRPADTYAAARLGRATRQRTGQRREQEGRGRKGTGGSDEQHKNLAVAEQRDGFGQLSSTESSLASDRDLAQTSDKPTGWK